MYAYNLPKKQVVASLEVILDIIDMQLPFFLLKDRIWSWHYETLVSPHRDELEVGGTVFRLLQDASTHKMQNHEKTRSAGAPFHLNSHFRRSAASRLHARRPDAITVGPDVRPVHNLVSSGLSAPVEASAAVYRFFAGEQVLQGLHDVAPLLFVVAFRVRPHREASHCGDTDASAIRQDGVRNTPLQTRNVRQAEDSSWHRSVVRPPHPVFC